MSSGSYQWQAGVQTEQDNNKRTHPTSERNKQPILDELRKLLPSTGSVLEVASGTGQHVAFFAAALPNLHWQPTDVTDQLFSSIVAHASGLSNVEPPKLLDASLPAEKWPVAGPAAAVIASNVTHIAPWSVTQGLVAGAGKLLQPGGILFIYGPFKLNGEFTTDSNRDFHNSLVSSNPEWGYRNTDDVTALAQEAGLEMKELIHMPANNFALVYRKV